MSKIKLGYIIPMLIHDIKYASRDKITENEKRFVTYENNTTILDDRIRKIEMERYIEEGNKENWKIGLYFEEDIDIDKLKVCHGTNYLEDEDKKILYFHEPLNPFRGVLLVDKASKRWMHFLESKRPFATLLINEYLEKSKEE